MNEEEKREVIQILIDHNVCNCLCRLDKANCNLNCKCLIAEKIQTLIERAEKEELKSYIETLKQIIDLDKTPAYGYDKKEKDKNNIGQFSLAGRWKTPREYCQDMLRDKEQALSEMSKELEGEGEK